MVPTSDGGDDFIGVGSPLEGLGVVAVMLGDETVDGGLEVDQRVKDAALQPAFGQPGQEGEATSDFVAFFLS